MSYFPDLSTYGYGRRHRGMLHIGWLDDLHYFPRGEVGEEVVAKLKWLAKRPVNSLFGFHVCQICCPPSLKNNPSKEYLKALDNPRCRGNGEIRITLNDVTYAAPVLLVHYIEDHGYLPPEEFLQAVVHGVAILPGDLYPAPRPGRKVEKDGGLPAFTAQKEGTAIKLKCRTPGEAWLVWEELEKAGIIALLPGEEELKLQLSEDGCVDLRVSAKAYESNPNLRSVVEFQHQRVKAEQSLPHRGKFIAMGSGALPVPGVLVFAWMLSNYKKEGYQRMAKELTWWFLFGITAWVLILVSCFVFF